MAPARKYLDMFFSAFSLGYPGRLLFYGMVIGILSGIAAVVFFYGLEVVQHFLFGGLCNYHVAVPVGERILPDQGSEQPIWWVFFLLPILGGLAAGFIVYRFAPEAEGVGTEAMIDCFHNKRAVIRTRVPYLKGLASLITLGTGGSVGREGPISQIGAGLGSWVASRLHLGVRQRRILLLAGAAGGLGAIFRAPLGAAISAVEVLYWEDIESEALLPSVISSVTAYTLFSSIFGYDRIFEMPLVTFSVAAELPFYLALALLCIPLGIFYVRMFHAVRSKLFAPLKVSPYLKPAIGGLCLALLGLIAPQVYGTSWGLIQDALLGKVALQTMMVVGLLKMFSTAFTLGSGGSGGVFGPTLFIGGMVGGVVGTLGSMVAPDVVTEPHAYVLVGMAAFFAGVANAPLGVLLMVCEITGGYNLVAPLLLVSVVAILFSRGYTIFPSQVRDKFHSPGHLGDMTFNVLEDIAVDACYHPMSPVPVFAMQQRISDLPDWIREPHVHLVLVTDKKGRTVGFVPGDTLRAVPETGAMPSLIILYDVMEKYRPVSLEDDLFLTLGRLRRYHQKVLPVVDSAEKPVGCITQEDLMEAYAKAVDEKKGVEE